MGRSRRISRSVTSVGAVFPPHSLHRSWWSAIRRRTFDPDSRISTVLTGGQRLSMAMPTGRLHNRHVISATKTVVAAEGNSAEQ